MTDTPAPRAGTRVGCCKDWPKPCTYHQGYEDGLEDGRLEGAKAMDYAWRDHMREHHIPINEPNVDAVLDIDEDGDEA